MPKWIYAVIAAVVVVVILAYVLIGSATVPTVVNGDTVEVYYTGAFANGTQFNSNVGGQPLTFVVGSNQIISGFDQAVIGMKLNETKNITLQPSEAYGQVNPSLIMHVPLSIFGNQTVKVGSIVTSNSSSGVVQGRVTSVNTTDATVDFNPPLAGKTLDFTIRIVGIQKG